MRGIICCWGQSCRMANSRFFFVSSGVAPARVLRASLGKWWQRHILKWLAHWMYGMHCNQNRKLHCKKQVARSRGVGHWTKCIAMWKLCETVFQSIETTADVAESNQARNSPTYNGSGSQQCWKQFSFDASIGCVVRTSVVLETRQGVSQQPSEPLRFYEEVIQLFGRNSAVGEVFHAFFKVYFNREHHPNSKIYLY